MKHNDIKNITKKLYTVNMENIFNVYIDNELLSDKYFYNMLKTVIIPSDLNKKLYEEYTVIMGDTWPKLAYNFFGQVEAWWIICITNNIYNPLNFPEPGSILKILNRNAARQILTVINEK
jgi:hypothetical protein